MSLTAHLPEISASFFNVLLRYCPKSSQDVRNFFGWVYMIREFISPNYAFKKNKYIFAFNLQYVGDKG